MSFRVRLTRGAEAELDRLFDFVLERESKRPGGRLELAEQALAAIHAGIATLKSTPFTCRKAGSSPYLRELIIPFGGTGDVALFEIVSESDITVAALRHQREDDYQ